MIQKALDEKGKRLFADGDRATLRREVEAAVLQEIQLAMLESGSDKEVAEVEKDLKSEYRMDLFIFTSEGIRKNG